MSVNLQITDSIEGFKALQKEWDDLYLKSNDTTIFQSWDWMYTWWEVFHHSLNSQLFILGFYENDRLIGLAPFHICNSFPKSIIQGRTITFIGSGEKTKDKIVSQYLDLIVSSDKKELVIESFSAYLIEIKNKWDFADFEFLQENSLVSQCFKGKNSNIHTKLSQYGNRFYIPEMKDFTDFQNHMGSRWRKMYNKKYRKLNTQGNAKIEFPNDIESTKSAFQQLAKMHGERWENRTEINIFKSKLFNEFHTKILERLVPQDKAFIKTLSLDNKPLSSYYCFKDKSQIHYYQSGFYTENANKYSPLFLLVCTEIGEAIKDKHLFDFMFDENPLSYKKEQYAAQSKPMYRLMWSPNKSRMIKHAGAKSLQSKYLKLKSSFVRTLK